MIESCYLCGATDKPLTKDHVPPKVVFPKPRPNNLICVKACFSCNNGLSKDDELLAVYLSAAIATNDAGKFVRKNAAKKILRRSPAFATQLLAGVTKDKILTQFGLVEANGLEIPDESLRRMMFRLAKGLVRHLDPHFVYLDHTFTLVRLDPLTKANGSLLFVEEAVKVMGRLERGDGVFRCLYAFDDQKAMLVLIFYDSVGFIVTASPRQDQELSGPGHTATEAGMV